MRNLLLSLLIAIAAFTVTAYLLPSQNPLVVGIAAGAGALAVSVVQGPSVRRHY